MTDTRRQVKDFAKVAWVFLGFYVAAVALRHWLQEPVAVGLAVIVVMLADYWIPPKPRMSYVKWGVVSVVLAIFAFIFMSINTSPYFQIILAVLFLFLL